MRILITGRNSQLAKSFIKELDLIISHQVINNQRDAERAIYYRAFGHTFLDICDYRKVKQVVESDSFDIIINCASYNDVESAEIDNSQAFSTNAVGVANLANICKEKNIFLVHFSTDYVFDGKASAIENKSKVFPYVESDITRPLNKYGQSKLLGEQIIQNIDCDYHIYRLSWLYGNGKQNFIYKFLQWLKTSDRPKVTNDEISVPTSCDMVADVVLEMLEYRSNISRRLFHLTNAGFCSRYEWAVEICKCLNITDKIIPITTDKIQHCFKAVRPKFSAMNNNFVSALSGVKILSWQEELHKYLKSEEFMEIYKNTI